MWRSSPGRFPPWFGLTGTAVAALLMACGAPAPPEDVPQPVAIGSASPAAPQLVEHSSVVHRLRPIDLVEGDGELLLHLDLKALRQSVFFPGVRGLLTQEERKLRQVRDRCGFNAFDAFEQVAASMHNLDSNGPLIVAELAVSEDQVRECLRKVWPDGKARKVGPYDGYALRESRRSMVVVVNDGMLFLGSPTEIRRAIGRRKVTGCAPVNLRAALPVGPDTPAAVLVESGSEEVYSLAAKVVMRGPQLDLTGEVQFRDTSWRKATVYAERAERDLLEARDELRQVLERGLGNKHPLIAQLGTLSITRQGERISASLSVTSDASVGPALDNLMKQLERRGFTSEAKNTIGAMSRGAQAAYERETYAPGSQPAHQLCTSAIDVPAKVPRGVAYQPDTTPGKDFDTGDVKGGWKCLKFSLSQPHRYQYSYRQGGNYKGPRRGGPDPGPNGYEVSAEGDLDGDGKTSLFTRTGTVTPGTSTLRASSQIFIDDEFE